MKIISDYKDYYDYVIGYDTDPRKVYLRTRKDVREPGQDRCEGNMYYTIYENKKQVGLYPQNLLYVLGFVYFCDRYYPFVHDVVNNKFNYNYEDISETSIGLIGENTVNDHFRRADKRKYRWRWSQRSEPKNLNAFFKVPVVIASYDFKHNNIKVELNGCLADVKFPAVKDSKAAYTEIYNWVPFIEPDVDTSPDNMSRFESKGFDKKHSFRNTK